MKILLTGATGLVGQELGLELVRQGHALVVTTRTPSKWRGALSFPATLIEWDGKTALQQTAFAGVDAVIHLAGESIASGRWSDERKESILKSRVQSTRQLAAGIAEAVQAGQKIRTFICASAVGIYGDRAEQELTEESPSSDGDRNGSAVEFLAHVCQEWEKAAIEGLPASVRAAQVRIGIVLSSQGGALAQMLPIFKKGAGGPLGGGNQWMSWIHVSDLARLFCHVLSTDALSGGVNGVSSHPVRNRDFTHALGAALHRPALLPTPATALKLVLGGFAQAVLSSQKVMPSKALESGFKFRFEQLEEALADLIPNPADERLITRQWVAAGLDQVFGFFSDAVNLERITPPFLNFQVLGMSTARIQKGSLIDYRLKLRGLPVKWRTLIDKWEPQSAFVDTQLKGPYQKWHHAHRFETLAGGVLVEDEVFYRLPMSWLGDLVAGAYVRGDVQKIFDYRRQAIAEIFSGSPAENTNEGR